MKNLLVFFVLLSTFFACKKSTDEVVPDIAGVYQINTLQNQQGETLTFPTLSSDGKVTITSELEITKIDEFQINVVRRGVAFGAPYTDPLGLFDIRKSEGEYIVYKDGLYIGTLNGSKLYLNFAGKSRNTMIATIRASK